MEPPPTQTAQSRQDCQPLALAERIGILGVGMMLAGLLGVAAFLHPESSGVGTHMQLGLPGCTSYTLLGIRCPGCGMTTSWAHTMDGDLVSGLQANVGGVLLCLLAIMMTPCFLWIGSCGDCRAWSVASRVCLSVLITAFGISVIEWLGRLLI
jgi:hypothetical protein